MCQKEMDDIQFPSVIFKGESKGSLGVSFYVTGIATIYLFTSSFSYFYLEELKRVLECNSRFLSEEAPTSELEISSEFPSWRVF